MKLYTFFVAPNPTKVGLYLAEKRAAGGSVSLETVTVNLVENEQRSPEHLARNPLGKLPVLELDDGSFLTESLVIIEYLEERHPEPPMIGHTPEERARVRSLERTIDLGVLVQIGRWVHATDSPTGQAPDPAVAKSAHENLQDGLAFVDDVLSDGRAFVAGERPTIADCTLAAGLQFGRFRKLEVDPRFAHVRRWDAAYREREAPKSVLVM